jgi:hypothetical protein
MSQWSKLGNQTMSDKSDQVTWVRCFIGRALKYEFYSTLYSSF